MSRCDPINTTPSWLVGQIPKGLESLGLFVVVVEHRPGQANELIFLELRDDGTIRPIGGRKVEGRNQEFPTSVWVIPYFCNRSGLGRTFDALKSKD